MNWSKNYRNIRLEGAKHFTCKCGRDKSNPTSKVKYKSRCDLLIFNCGVLDFDAQCSFETISATGAFAWMHFSFEPHKQKKTRSE